MIVADRVFTGIREAATLAPGEVPRRRAAMRELGVVRAAAIATRAGRVVWVGPERRLTRAVRLSSGARRVDLEGACVLPGLVDAHTHLLFHGDRHAEITRKLEGWSYGEIARAGGGILRTVRATRRATDAELLASGLDRLRRMARWGTTALEAKSGYALTVEGELRLLRLIPRLARATGLEIVPTFLGAHAVPPEFAGRSQEYVTRLIDRALPRVAREGLARFCDVFCEPGFFSAREAERLLRAASALGLGTKLHADEFAASGGAELAARLRATSADHLLSAPPSAFPALARAGVTAVVLPITPFAALSPLVSPARALLDAGVPVALGSDLSPNSWVEGMPLAMAHAVYSARLTPSEAITASTVNAAHAIGLGASAGQIAVGRWADLAAFPVGHVEEVPYRIGALPSAVYRRAEPVFST
jgi:imidazolonepropionase